VDAATIVGLFALVIQACLLVLLLARRAYRRFPFFLSYTIFAVLVEVARMIVAIRSFNTWTYFYLYWGGEAVYAVLGFLAMYEVFREVFSNFYRLAWFRFLMPSVGGLMLLIAALIPLTHPPSHAPAILALIFNLQIAVRCLQLGVFLLIFLLARVFNLYYRQYAFGISAGFGIAAMGILAGTLVRTHFGLQHGIFFQFAPAVSYCVAVAVWLVSFVRPEPTDPFADFQHLFTPELFLRELERYRREIREVLRP